MRPWLAGMVGLALLCGVDVPAVAGQGPVPGQKVRVTAPERGVDRRVGELVRLGPDSLVFLSGRAITALALPAVARLDTVAGEHRHTVHGALVGGLAAGLFVGQDMLRKPSQCSGSGEYGQVCALILVGSVAVGAGVGALVGHAIRHDEWVSISPTLEVDLGRRTGPAVRPGLSLRPGLSVRLSATPR